MAEEKAAPKQLIEKLVEAVKSIGRVPKDGRNDFHNYNYATAEDVKAVARKALSDQGLFLQTTVENYEQKEVASKRGTQTLTTVHLGCTLRCVDSDETLQFVMFGEGQDAGDKSISKAITAATKYALIELLLIPTGDDPEADPSTDQAATERQPSQPPAEPPPQQGPTKDDLQTLADLIRKTQTDGKKLVAHFGVERLRELTNEQFDTALATLQQRYAEQQAKTQEAPNAEF